MIIILNRGVKNVRTMWASQERSCNSGIYIRNTPSQRSMCFIEHVQSSSGTVEPEEVGTSRASMLSYKMA